MGQEIDNVRMCAAKNGLIVSYDCYSTNDQDKYSSRSWQGEEKEVFKLSEKQKAIDCFIEYATKAGIIVSDEDKDED